MGVQIWSRKTQHSPISAMNIPATSHSEKPGTFKTSLKRLISRAGAEEKVRPTSSTDKMDINMNPPSSPEVAETERRPEVGIESESSPQPPPPAPVPVVRSRVNHWECSSIWSNTTTVLHTDRDT